MPYATNNELPDGIKGGVKAEAGRDIMREVINSQLEAGKSEAVAFASAWAALQRAGYEQNDDGEWVDKTLTLGDVHVPSAEERGIIQKFVDWLMTRKADFKTGDMVEWNSSGGTASGKIVSIHREGNVPNIPVKITASEDKPSARIQIYRDGEATDTFVGHKLDALRVKKNDSYKLPQSARNNAKKVLEWKEKYGDEVKGMTETGWRRARQLAENESVGLETVKAMAQFNRHRKNAEVASEFKNEPWKDRGYVAWLGWGGTTGIDWAIEQSERIRKDDGFTFAADILKSDEDQRLVYGWASIIFEDGEPVTDSQGDIIAEDDLLEAAHNYVSQYRAAKAMHEGDQIGEVVESLVFTSDVQKALGIDLGKVGWFIGMKIHDDAAWSDIKENKLAAFSIGGRGRRIEIDD